MAGFDRGAGWWNPSRYSADRSTTIDRESKGATLVQLLGSSIPVPCIFHLSDSNEGHLVELKYVAGHDLLQRNSWSRFELAGYPALST